MYSDFYEIPLPALRFEKVEETDTKKVKNDTEEKQRSKEKQIHSLDEVKKPKDKTTLKQRSKKSRITRKKTTRKADSSTLPEQKNLL